jgi:hypothetical protein
MRICRINRKKIRPGIFHGVPDLISSIKEFINLNNEEPKLFIWTASSSSIMEKINRCKANYNTGH